MQNMQKHAIANCRQTVSRMLTHDEYKQWIPPLAKLHWSSFSIYVLQLLGRNSKAAFQFI